MRDTLKGELPSSKGSVFQEAEKAERMKSEFGQHPAVRPHSLESERPSTALPVTVVRDSARIEATNAKHEEGTESKEGERPDELTEESSPYPMYSRCACCGKLRKPAGFVSNLTPVLENEHLRTNFTLELGRGQTEHHRRQTDPGSPSRPKHIPIIPMEVGNELRQATIEPYRPAPTIEESPEEDDDEETPVLESGLVAAVSKSIDTGTPISNTHMPITIVRGKDEPKVVRFANMYQRKKEIERLGRDRRPRPGQEQFHSSQQFDDLNELNNDKTDGKIPLQSNERIPKENVRSLAVENLAESSSSSELDLVDQMPTPPSTSDSKESFTEATAVAIPLIAPRPQKEPESFVEQAGPGVDLSSMAGGLHTPYAPNSDITESLTNKLTGIDTKHHAQKYSQQVDDYSDIANSSPYSEDSDVPITPVKAYFPKRANDSNSSSEALPLPPPTSPGRPTTVVRIIPTPTIPLPERSPKRPGTATSTREPLRLGDWILPASASPLPQKPQGPYRYPHKTNINAYISSLDSADLSSADSSCDHSLLDFFMSGSFNSSQPQSQVRQANNTRIAHVVTGGNGRVKEVGRDIAKRMREAERRVGVTV